jgi:DNA-binding SARP family transcriptional activator/streptogramin lyase
MEYRLLGVLEVCDADGPLAIGGGKQRAVLAVLLLHPNEVATSEHLIHELWGDDPPASAGKILQKYVSKLRRSLGDGVVLTRGHGYELAVDADAIDTERFERLVEEGRRSAQPEQIRQALALWRGPALADFIYEAFAQPAISRLEEMRLSAIEELAEHELVRGRHAVLVSELHAFVAGHPFRERARAQLMLALYRCGRQAEALDVYRQGRRLFVDELGLEPGPQLQELERAILRQDASLLLPGPPESGPGDSEPPLRGVVDPGPETELPPSGRRRRSAIAVGVAAALGAAAVGALLLIGGRAASAIPKAVPNSLAVIDAGTGRMIADLRVGERPTGVASGYGSVWVANTKDETITRIDPRAARVVDTIGIGAQASAIAAGDGAIWAVTGNDGTIIRIDPISGALTASLPLHPQPHVAFAVTAGSGGVWASNGSALEQVAPSGSRVVASVTPERGTVGALTTNGRTIWEADTGEKLYRIDAATRAITDTVTIDDVPTALTMGFGSVWAAGGVISSPASVWRIDPGTAQIMSILRVGSDPQGIAAGAHAVWVADSAQGTVYRIDPTSDTVVAAIHIGGHPTAIAVANGKVWVAMD